MSALIFSILIFYFSLVQKKFSKNIFYMIMFLPLLLIVTVRPFNWGADAGTYIEMYNMVNAGQKINTEITFSFLSKIAFLFCNCAKLLFVFYALISLNLKIYSIENNSYLPLVSLLIYFSCWFVLHDVYQIRVGAAIGVSYFSIPYLCKKNYVKFLLMAFLATLFHSQAALLFLMIFLPKRKISVCSILFLCFIILISYAFYFLKFDLLSGILEVLAKSKLPRVNQLKYYYDIAHSGIIDLGRINAFSPIVLVRLFLSLILLFQYKKLNEYAYYPVLIRILILSFAVRMFFYSVPVIGMRIYEFFTCFDVFVFPLFFKIIKEKKAVFFFLIFYCLFMLFIILR